MKKFKINIFNIFNKNKETIKENREEEIREEITEDNKDFFEQDNATDNMELFLDKLFECEKLYTFVFCKTPNIEKYYMQVIDSKLLGFLYTNEDNANNYLNEELKDINKDIKLKEINTEEIIDYIDNLRTNSINGIIINYPNNWVIFEIKN